MISIKSLRYFGDIEYAMSIRTDNTQRQSDYIQAKEQLQNYISALESENAALKERLRWIRTEEKLPEFYAPKLVAKKRAKYPVIMERAKEVGDLWSWANRTLNHFVGYTDDISQVTHWMPLPELPELPKKGGEK